MLVELFTRKNHDTYGDAHEPLYIFAKIGEEEEKLFILNHAETVMFVTCNEVSSETSKY